VPANRESAKITPPKAAETAKKMSVTRKNPRFEPKTISAMETPDTIRMGAASKKPNWGKNAMTA